MTIEMLREIVRFANENEAFMDGTTDPVYGIMDQAQIVFAVWKDETAAHASGVASPKAMSFYSIA